MTDLEPRPESAPPTTGQQEPWSIWWSRVVQVAGLGIIAHQEFIGHLERKWLLLCAMAMMLGEIGLKAALRFFLRQAGGGE